MAVRKNALAPQSTRGNQKQGPADANAGRGKEPIPFDELIGKSIGENAVGMNAADFAARVAAVFRFNGIGADLYTPDKTDAYRRFLSALLGVNRVMNLTAIRDAEEAILKHLADSLTVAPYLPLGASVVDLGCGGGFPSVPLAIARPDLSILALDSTAKKTDFVAAAARELDLTNLKVAAGRAEEWVNEIDPETKKPRRERVDVVVSRAVARMNVLDELALPMIRPGGILIAMKGAKGEDELEEARNGIRILGGNDIRTLSLTLNDPQTAETGAEPDGSAAEKRVLILVTKMRKTEDQYPRSYAQILKKPL